jgi:hypothetical protein
VHPADVAPGEDRGEVPGAPGQREERVGAEIGRRRLLAAERDEVDVRKVPAELLERRPADVARDSHRSCR